MSTKTRKSVPVDQEDLRVVDLLRRERAYKDALRDTAGFDLDSEASEAETMHALLVAGREAVKDRVMHTGYAALAAAQTDEDVRISRAMSRRRARQLED